MTRVEMVESMKSDVLTLSIGGSGDDATRICAGLLYSIAYQLAEIGDYLIKEELPDSN